MQAVNIKPTPRTSSGFIKNFSSIVSFVFHPLLIVSYVAIAVYIVGAGGFAAIPRVRFLEWTAILFLSTVFFPFLSILLLRLTGMISNAFMYKPGDRILPLTATLIFYVWAFYFFQDRASAPLLLRSLLLGAVFSIMLDFFINLFYKVSVHTTAAAMMPGNILVLWIIDPATPLFVLVITTLAAILVGLVRWWLGSHTKGQILLGYSIGILMQLTAYFLLRSI